GGINKKYKPGDIVVIKDHINFMGDNPLRGEHEPEFGERFPDMTYTYNRDLISKTLKIAKSLGIKIHIGVYLATRGPSYETPAEIDAFRKFGADVVGMSVVPEAIVAHQAGINILCLSYISNMASGISKKILSHEEVIETGNKVSKKLILLLEELIKKCS
ncbi:MAG: purine-nucleoside phosphorylase, partial [Endomicrobiia bacterium]